MLRNSVPKREKIAARRLQLANCATFLHVSNPVLPCVMHMCEPWRHRVRVRLCWQRACEWKLIMSPSAAAVPSWVSEFRKYSQGGERIGPKFATLRAKCGEIQSEKFGRFVSERTVSLIIRCCSPAPAGSFARAAYNFQSNQTHRHFIFITCT